MVFKDASTVEMQLLIEWVHMQYVSRIDTAKEVRPLVIEKNLPSTFDSALHVSHNYLALCLLALEEPHSMRLQFSMSPCE